jgi:hypothetical protein
MTATEQNTLITNVIWESTKLGSKLGLILSSIYGVAGMLIFVVVPSIGELGIRDIPWIAGFIFYIFLLAVLPSTIIGLLTGIIIGWIVEFKFTKKFSKITFLLASIATCSLIAVLIHILFDINIVLSFEPPSGPYSLGYLENYPFLFGIPTIIYVLAGGWFGWKIYSKFITS